MYNENYRYASNRVFLAVVNYAIFFFVFLFATYFSGYRDFTAGNDTINYINTFRNISGVGDAYDVGTSYYGSQEYLFWMFSGVIKEVFGDSPRIWLLANSSLSIILSAFIYRKFSEVINFRPWAILFLFLFCTYELVFVSSVMRQAIAVPIMFYSLFLAFEGRRKSALLLFVVAMLFHYSVFLFLPLIISLFLRADKLFRVAVLPVSLVFGYFLLHFIGIVSPLFSGTGVDNKINLYISEGFQAGMEGRSVFSSFNMVLSICIAFMILLFSDKSSFFYKVTFYVIALIFVFLDFPIIEVRILPYFIFLYPFLYIIVVSRFLGSYSFKILFGCFLFLVILC